MPHIAMVSIPFHGHVNPSLDIIRTLVRRGHRVTYANDPRLRRGHPVHRRGAEAVRLDAARRGAGAGTDDPIAQLTLFLDDAVAMLPQLRAAYAGDRPDLFLYDIAGAPARLARASSGGIPAVQLSSTGSSPGTATSRRWRPYRGGDAGRSARHRSYYRRFTAWLTTEGSSVTDSMAFQGRPLRSLVLPGREALQAQRRPGGAGRVYSFVGPVLADRAPARVPGYGRGARREGAARLARLRLHRAAAFLPPLRRRVRRSARLAHRSPDRQVRQPGRTRSRPGQRRGSPVGAAAGRTGAGGCLRHPRRRWAAAAKVSTAVRR